MKPYLLFCCFLLSLKLQAQDKMRFRSLTSVGIQFGDKGRSADFHTINGVAYRDWFAGVGLGLDDYRVQSMPLYASFAREWKMVRNAFVLRADGGVNLSEMRPGFYTREAIGYRISMKKNKASVLLDFGHSFKQSREVADWQIPCNIEPCPEGTKLRQDYKFNRLSLRLGLQF